MEFALSEIEVQKIKNWLKKHNESCPHAGHARVGAMSSRIAYKFIPTRLGPIARAECVCGSVVTLSNL